MNWGWKVKWAVEKLVWVTETADSEWRRGAEKENCWSWKVARRGKNKSWSKFRHWVEIKTAIRIALIRGGIETSKRAWRKSQVVELT